jgi:hypothetical protein
MTDRLQFQKLIKLVNHQYPITITHLFPIQVRRRKGYKLDITHLETESASLIEEYLVRVQIPPDDVSRVLAAITGVAPLSYGKYEQVAFRSKTGTLQFKPLAGSKPGETDLFQLPSDEISFTLPANDQLIAAVIESIFESHPYEEPVILIQPVMSTRFKYGTGKDNLNKWWHRPEQD